MNRLYILICFLALTTTAFGQLSQLDEYFKKQDRYQIWHSQNNGSNIIGHTWRIEFNEPLTPSDIDAIRNAFASARKDASESYMYEYHKDGTDSIKYSLLKRNVMSKFFDFEKALFENDALKAEYYYYHEYYEPKDVANYDMKQLDAAAVKALIEPVLESVKQYKGANIYPIHWQHDEGYEDNVAFNGGIDAIAFYDKNHVGKTTGTHYFLPAQYEKEGGALCLLIDSLAHDYVNRHPEQNYHYFYYSTNHDFRIRNILGSNGNYRENQYSLGYYRDEEGLHFFSTTTDGELWMPKDWTKIKRWVNGKITYLK